MYSLDPKINRISNCPSNKGRKLFRSSMEALLVTLNVTPGFLFLFSCFTVQRCKVSIMSSSLKVVLAYVRSSTTNIVVHGENQRNKRQGGDQFVRSFLIIPLPPSFVPLVCAMYYHEILPCRHIIFPNFEFIFFATFRIQPSIVAA